MSKEKSQEYLAAMGIEVWHPRSMLQQKKRLVGYPLLNEQSLLMGYFCLLPAYLDNQISVEETSLLKSLLSVLPSKPGLMESPHDLDLDAIDAAKFILIMAQDIFHEAEYFENNTSWAKKIIVTHHPRVLLKDPIKKRDTWLALKKIFTLVSV